MRPLILAAAVGTFAAAAGAQQQQQSTLPAWTKGATCYEIFVRSFYDSDGDGIGDLRGLTAKLDYVNDGNPRTTRDLGARCIWLMPVAEARSYHGYDVTDYTTVERDFGTNEDFKRFVAAAHARGIKVLVDMVLNHTSDQHPWFQEALRDTTSRYRSWYRFSPTKPAELNPWGQSNWHKSPVRDEWYYGFFWGGMPDLNWTNPAVAAEADSIARFWLTAMKVDGFRLDAVPYLVEENGAIMNSPSTHAALRDYERYVRSVKPDVYTVGEVSFSGDTLLGYYPDQLDSYFAFELADSIVAAVRDGRRGGMLAPLLRLQREVPGQRWSPFVGNHDQTRSRTKLGGDLGKARLASFLLLTMPGLPFLYYGEEIGMTGDKPDERLRTPMQWSRAPHGGFTSGTPWEALQGDSLAVTVAAQDRDPSSLLNWHRRLIHLRDANPALGAGVLAPVDASDGAVAAYVRRAGDRAVLVLANLGAVSARGVTITAPAGSLPAGQWRAVSLLDKRRPASVRVAADGSVAGWIPLDVLAPGGAYLVELRR